MSFEIRPPRITAWADSRSEREAWLAAVTSRTPSDMDVAAVGAVMLPTFPAFEDIHSLTGQVSGEIRRSHDRLAACVLVSDGGRTLLQQRPRVTRHPRERLEARWCRFVRGIKHHDARHKLAP